MKVDIMCTINAVIKKPVGAKFTCVLKQLASGPRIGPQETSGVKVKPSWTLPWETHVDLDIRSHRRAARTHNEGCSWFQTAPTGQILRHMESGTGDGGDMILNWRRETRRQREKHHRTKSKGLQKLASRWSLPAYDHTEAHEAPCSGQAQCRYCVAMDESHVTRSEARI